MSEGSPRSCANCGKPVPPERRRYCSEGCADIVAHRKRLERLQRGGWKLARYRVYDYRDRGQP
jgi:predicted nucleic acid-binding Zn ribbon protein